MLSTISLYDSLARLDALLTLRLAQDLTRTEKGNDLFLQDPFDLSSTVTEAISSHKVEAQRLGLTLDVVESPSGTPPTVLGDRGKIRQIITNVIANAGASPFFSLQGFSAHQLAFSSQAHEEGGDPRRVGRAC